FLLFCRGHGPRVASAVGGLSLHLCAASSRLSPAGGNRWRNHRQLLRWTQHDLDTRQGLSGGAMAQTLVEDRPRAGGARLGSAARLAWGGSACPAAWHGGERAWPTEDASQAARSPARAPRANCVS